MCRLFLLSSGSSAEAILDYCPAITTEGFHASRNIRARYFLEGLVCFEIGLPGLDRLGCSLGYLSANRVGRSRSDILDCTWEKHVLSCLQNKCNIEL